MPYTLVVAFPAGSTTYPSDLTGNFGTIQDALNALESAINAVAGPTSGLMNDLYDRVGLVGDQSYNLDLAAYAGGALITVGRRPAPTTPEVDLSIAFGSYNGGYERVTKSGDTLLNAAGIIGGLPKTIYVGVPATGVPQLYEDTLTPNVLYIWSMTWDGVNLSSFRRIAPILLSYTLLQQVAGQFQRVSARDEQTDFVLDATGLVPIFLPGDEASNGIGVHGSLEILGFFVSVGPEQPNGFTSPVVGTVADAKVELDVYVGATKLSLTPLAIDTDSLPAVSYAAIDPAAGDARFVQIGQRLDLKRTSVGANVSSASGLTWGVLVRPVHGRTRAPSSIPTGLI